MDKNFRHIEDGFMTPEECHDMIDWAEKHGFEEAKISMRMGQGELEQVMRKDIRDNYRVVVDKPGWAAQLWDKVKHLVPEEEGWEAYGLNERFRFYRYEMGQQFKRHVDGAFTRDEGDKSMVTMLVYLNGWEDFLGGHTQFIDPPQIVTPEVGRLLLFKHRQVHTGDPVQKGIKYVLRTDIMYRRKQ